MRVFAWPGVVIFALLACTSGERVASSAETGGTIVIATPADAGDLLPLLAGDATAKAVSDLLFDRLAEISDSLSTGPGDTGFRPRLAQRWTWARDSLSIAFALDPRARWHDGQPARASDVRFTYRLAVDPKVASPIGPLLTNVDSVSLKDSLTAVVWFKHQRPEQFYDFVYQLPIMPEHVYATVPTDQLRTSEAARHPVGTGRFRFVRWDAGTRLEL